MGLVRYISQCSQYSTFLDLEDGRTIKLVFEGKDTITKERFADVADVMIQRALEGSKSFNIYFSRSSEWDNISTEELENMVVIPGQVTLDHQIEKLTDVQYDTITQAADWIHANHNIPRRFLTTSAQLIEKYKKLGFNLIIKSIQNL